MTMFRIQIAIIHILVSNFVTSVPNSNTTSYISDLIDGMYNWDIQILHSGMDSILFQPKKNYNLPTTLYHMSLNDRKWKNHFNHTKIFLPVSKGRAPLPTLIILYFDLFLKLNLKNWYTLVSLWDAVYNNKLLKLLGTIGDYLFQRYTHVLLATSMTRHELMRYQLGFAYPTFHDFSIAYYVFSNNFEICVMPQGRPIQFSVMNCKFKTAQPLVRIILQLAVPATQWHFQQSVSDLDISRFEHNEVIAPQPNLLDPFRSMQSTYLHLVHTSFQKANATLIRFILGCSEYDSTPHLLFINMDLNNRNYMMVVIDSLSYKFLTCYSEKHLSFELYIMPFEPNLWMALIASIVTLATIMQVFLRLTKRADGPIYFSPLLFIFSSLCEESMPIENQLERKKFFRLALGSWLLVSVILTNCYNGLMITELNAPLPGWHPQLFTDLICSSRPEIDSYLNDPSHNVTKWLVSNRLHTYARHWVSMSYGFSPTLMQWRRLQYHKDCFRMLSPPVQYPSMSLKNEIFYELF